MPADTEALVRYLVSSLVADRDSVTLSVRESDGTVVYEIAVASDDIGKIIGRQGRIIKAIRTLARAASTTSGKQVEVEVAG
jgi:predicted RNA-binding protein YlqC (UPF0109 family)